MTSDCPAVTRRKSLRPSLLAFPLLESVGSLMASGPLNRLTFKNGSLSVKIDSFHKRARLTVYVTGPEGGDHWVNADLTAHDLREAAKILLEAADDLDKQQGSTSI